MWLCVIASIIPQLPNVNLIQYRNPCTYIFWHTSILYTDVIFSSKYVIMCYCELFNTMYITIVWYWCQENISFDSKSEDENSDLDLF